MQKIEKLTQVLAGQSLAFLLSSCIAPQCELCAAAAARSSGYGDDGGPAFQISPLRSGRGFRPLEN